MEEQRLLSGKLYNPKDIELKQIKMATHNLCTKYNQLFEDDVEKRTLIIKEIFKNIGENNFFQGPIFIHYGNHTQIGDNFFGNFNLVIQDDAEVSIGDNCDFGPNVTIVTPLHPLVAEERLGVIVEGYKDKKYCYAKPVTIGNNCWLGANVTVCPGVTIGDNCVIGAGSVVTRDITKNTIAVGSPCKILREISPSDSVLLNEKLV